MDQGTQRLIRRHNAQMRDLIVRDIDALEQKLNVKRQVTDMADNAVHTVKGKLGMNAPNSNGGLLDFVRHNAAPLAAVGLGGAVLAKNLRASVAESSSTTSPTTAHFDPTSGGSSGQTDDASLRERAGSKVADAKEAVADVKGTVVDAKDTVATQAVVAKDAVVERIPSRQEIKVVARDHGQVVGVAALAVGAAVGVLTPRTKVEERHLAPAQSQLRDKASELADQGLELAKEKVDTVTEAVSSGVETVREELETPSGDDTPDPGGSMVSGATDLPDMTRPDRITGSRIETSNGAPGRSY